MADNIQCPHCEAEIEADSIFCDQCGKELNKCPRCGLFRRGRFCPTCGVPTEPAAKLAAQQPQQPEPQQPEQTPQPVQQPVQQSYGSGGYNQAFPTSSPAGGSGGTQIQGAEPAQASPTKLTCRELGIIIPLQPDAVIGRNTGNYVAQLSGLRFLSGRHAQLSLNGVQWSITDLGSTNGTAVNGMPCTPMQPQPFTLGDTICLAKSYNFIPE